MILTDNLEAVDLDPRVIAELSEDLDRIAHPSMSALNFTYDTSIDSPNYSPDGGRGPDSITLHWWGSPSLHRDGVGAGVARYLSTRAAQASAHYVATVQTADRAEIVYQIIADADNAWHSGSNAGNATSLGIEMMPFDDLTPAWQVDALIKVAAQLVASLWHRWPHLKDRPLKGHRDWISTACPGSYYSRLDEILAFAQYWFPRYAGEFGQFNEDTQPEETLMPMPLLIVEKTRGMAVIAPGYLYPVPPAHVDAAHTFTDRQVHQCQTPEEWDALASIAVGGRTAAAAGVDPAAVAAQLKVVAK